MLSLRMRPDRASTWPSKAARYLLTIDGTPHSLRAGDSIYYAGDCVHAFMNPGKKPCVYYLAMDVKGDPALAKHRAWKPASGKRSAGK